mmetsp:Transcript_10690/g.31204  ORF Transcript_10690/g.31204 Transcript_10690/m.31204 type:complete len:321 (+) Transcript_10690:179-1141(+)
MFRFTPALLTVVLCIASGPSVYAFVLPKVGTQYQSLQQLSSSSLAADSGSDVDLGMTPELKRVTEAFASIEQEQVRYKQLLYMAQTTAEVNNLPESSKVPENKVPGCLSTVFVDGEAIFNDEMGDFVINFQGDSDGLMTKGLVALLVRCLSGNTAEAIQKVDPQFIKLARIDQSLTPGRNNGFLNMLQSMKNKATQLAEEAKSGPSPSAATTTASSADDADATENDATVDGEGPKYTAIVSALQVLKPSSLTVVDSSQENGSSEGEETHFVIDIVAPAFEGLNVIKRQQLIFMMLAEIMPEIQDLRIASMFTPEEAEQRS